MRGLAVLLLLPLLLILVYSAPDSAVGPISVAPVETPGALIKRDLGGASIVLTYKDQWTGLPEENEVAGYSPAVLRFPAGTHAMYFDWETGNYSGAKINAARERSGYGVDKFFELSARYGAKASYIVNIYQDTPEKTGRLAEYFKAKGYQVDFWEMGNEAYAADYSDRFQDAQAYLAAARAHAEQILSVFPLAQFGVTADPRNRYVSPWNSALLEQDFFKNIVAHKYFGPDRATREDMISRGVQPDPDQAYSLMLKDSDPGNKPNFACIFPGKRLWVTEWGLLYIGFDIEDSMAHALWWSRTFIKLMRTDNIDMAAYWNLNAPPFELIQPVEEGFMRRVPFYAYKMALFALKSGVETRAAVFTGAGSENFSGQYFVAADGSVSIFAVNSGAEPSFVEVPGASTGLSMEYISADSIMASNGYSYAFSKELRDLRVESVTPQTKNVEGKTVELPGYSVAVISFGR
ncbi:MAG TPA: hypothetical protein DDW94_03380 [Deltaproteobacteria bacterium]|nr:MAG: hypothetical protein A2Z79_10075 [Deltaproteobacteria bacterium GWA2_55_82]OGQ63017.1 MAG: hypothetical protein A3I81_06895 [Deltaproteobacteria bacterium RIFCSPLOWO2_02_FULL_55_12]OIJ72981.1 MAG: hypothetical protein A2V21_301130 [Deltaproteobacteria bacterium GWC2_55_46]HBG46010.1 hypothetical protein [Deltaproteobacteria bacterium]HCY11772.1 hypothetical protein [Deltaproteobacteria bacterium]